MVDAGAVVVIAAEWAAVAVLVVGEAVVGIGAADSRHQAVAGDLGDDRGRGDRHRQAVAADDRLGRAGQAGRQHVAVDQDVVGAERQAGHGAAHAPQRGAEDVHPVDPGAARDHDRDQPLLEDEGEEAFAVGRRQALRIVEALRHPAREENGRHHHRAGERPAAGLVDPGNQPRPLPPGPRLEAVGTGRRQVERQG
jgi:hypothetical protein